MVYKKETKKSILLKNFEVQQMLEYVKDKLIITVKPSDVLLVSNW